MRNPTRKDLTGNVFGRLTVIEFAGTDTYRNAKWACRCSCGQVYVATRHYLQKGKDHSCGCTGRRFGNAIAGRARPRPSSFPPRYTDLRGKVFGQLTALEWLGWCPKRGSSWLCACSCGNMHVAKAVPLLCGRNPSCGCDIRKNLKGRRYGRLTVSEFVGIREGVGLWRCQCDCGGIVDIDGKRLRSGRISCGCLTKGGLVEAVQLRRHMLARCDDPEHTAYSEFGARGITVCARWRYGENGYLGHQCLLLDMGRRPTPQHQLVLRDPQKNFDGQNCEWRLNAARR